MAEVVERMHHFTENKQGLKTLELQRPNSSNSSCPESLNFYGFFIVCLCVSLLYLSGKADICILSQTVWQ